MTINIPISALLWASVLALTPHIATAAEHTHLGWDLDAHSLTAAQAPGDVKELRRSIEESRGLAHAFAKFASDQDVTSAAMIRYGTEYANVHLLYRTADKAILVRARNMHSRLEPGLVETLAPDEWNRLFNKFRDYQQPPPTPLTRKMAHLPHGYSAIAHTYDKGVSRTYLMAAHDIEPVDDPNVISDFFCGVVLSGMHCNPGPKIQTGWVLKELREAKAYHRQNGAGILKSALQAAGSCKEDSMEK